MVIYRLKIKIDKRNGIVRKSLWHFVYENSILSLISIDRMERIAGGNAMKPVQISIRQEETGKRIKQMMQEHGYSVRDIQEAMGFENPQAIYKWLSGKSLPNLDNFLILSKILHTSMEEILVLDGDFVLSGIWSDAA